MTPLPNADNISRISTNMERQTADADVTGDVPPNTAPHNTSQELNLYLETDRLKTFEEWPIPFINKIDLASSGFYYTNRRDIVKCIYCQVEVGCWVEHDSPDFEHERHSPMCRYILWKKRSLQNTLSTDNAVNNGRNESESTSLVGEDTCGPNGIEAYGRKSPVMEMERMSVNNTEKKHGNVTEEPMNEEYIAYTDRLRTYITWPKPENSKLSPQTLSEAGFIYTGDCDRTTCFHCGGTLFNWDETDEPWIEHAHWFPYCKYVLVMKGQRYIDDSRLRKRESLALVQDEIKTTLDKLRENVSSVDVNNSNSKDKVNESSEGNKSNESSISEDAAEPLSEIDRESRMLCLICLEQERNSILLPCYHMVVCLNCANKLTTCCVCREPVVYRRRVYIP